MSAPPPFQLPKDSTIYIRSIHDRCEALIDSGIWNGLTRAGLRTWLNNFSGAEEKYFAARILDALIYRSHDQTIALMEHLLERSIPDGTINGEGLPHRSNGWLEALRGKQDPGIRLVAVGGPGMGGPMKSGMTIARLYTRQLGVNSKWMIWSTDIPRILAHGVTNFVFVDDFLGTGRQFSDFIKNEGLDRLRGTCGLLYAPLAAHAEGVQAIGRALPWIPVCSAERLGVEYGMFDPASLAFVGDVNSPESARAFYLSLLRRRRLRFDSRFRLGYGQLALAYVFAHATPNNTLPLFWYPTSGWTPLFPR